MEENKKKNTTNTYQALVMLGNINRETVDSVLNIVQQKYPTIEHVFLIDTRDSYKANLFELIHKRLGSHVTITHTVLPEDVRSAYERIVNVIEAAVKLYQKESILVDLTNGTKIHSSALYAISSLIGIDSMYQLVRSYETKDEIKYELEYKQIPKFDKIEILPKVGYFEIVYYLLELEEVFKNIPEASFIEYAYTKIRDGILEYFEIKTKNDNDYQRSLAETVKWVERSINILYEFVEEITNKKFNENNTTGKLRRIKTEIKKNNIPINHLKYLRGIPHLLELLWEYRHIPAHQSNIMYKISSQEAMIAIEASLEIFRRIKQDHDLFEKFTSVEL
ncbi:hypothetical protein BD01_1025 [Thermococcus nautili]|uniref:Uncharacterized protein n=2 Tax=Thermococcus nautili TaxID=195522 RepID=W8NTQ0_9EURY|nr:hypothetical protein BD01_1025 [Thermococcus nautili]